MSMSLAIRVNSLEFVTDFTMPDMEVLSRIMEGQESELGILLGSKIIGEWRKSTCSVLLASLEVVLNNLRAEQDKLLRVYSVKKRVPGVAAWSRSSGIGFESGGESYAIWAGLGRCELWKYRALPDGMKEVVEKRDIREVKRMAADWFGEIIIESRKAAPKLISKLENLKSSLASQAPDATLLVAFG